MKNVLKYHVPRLLHQLGRPVHFGGEAFKMASYYPCRFTTSSSQHERFMEMVLRRVLAARPGTFIDVGVNAGQTLAKVLSIDKNRSYIGFEPQISCCFNADQFIKANALTNAQVLPLALGDSNQMLSFYADGETDECASLMDSQHGTAARARTFVQCRVGDEVLNELKIGEVSAIKIDVEGAEILVMEGLKSTLAKLKPTVIFEVLPNFSGIDERVWHDPAVSANNCASADKIRELLLGLDYHLFLIDESNGSESRIDDFDLDNIENHQGSNFIAHPAGS